MMFLDASAIVAILNDEPGVEEIKRRLDAAAGPFLVSPLALFESTTAIARARSAGAKKPVDAKAIAQAKAVVAAFVEDLGARETKGRRGGRPLRQSGRTSSGAQFRRLLRLCLRQSLSRAFALQGRGLLAD